MSRLRLWGRLRDGLTAAAAMTVSQNIGEIQTVAQGMPEVQSVAQDLPLLAANETNIQDVVANLPVLIRIDGNEQAFLDLHGEIATIQAINTIVSNLDSLIRNETNVRIRVSEVSSSPVEFKADSITLAPNGAGSPHLAVGVDESKLFNFANVQSDGTQTDSWFDIYLYRLDTGNYDLNFVQQGETPVHPANVTHLTKRGIIFGDWASASIVRPASEGVFSNGTYYHKYFDSSIGNPSTSNYGSTFTVASALFPDNVVEARGYAAFEQSNTGAGTFFDVLNMEVCDAKLPDAIAKSSRSDGAGNHQILVPFSTSPNDDGSFNIDATLSKDVGLGNVSMEIYWQSFQVKD